MDLELYLAFVVATAAMILIPGPSVMLTVAHSLSFGAVRALSTVAGAVTAIGLQLLVAIAGMTSFMLLMADWFEVLRWAGVAWLLHLGVRQWRAPADPDEAPEVASDRSLFAQGFLVTVANPKSLIFLAAFFPQFVDPAASWGLQMAVLAPTFLVIGYVFTALWALAADRTRVWFRTRRRLRLRNRIAGSMMIGAAAGLALVRRG